MIDLRYVCSSAPGAKGSNLHSSIEGKVTNYSDFCWMPLCHSERAVPTYGRFTSCLKDVCPSIAMTVK